MGGGEEWMEAGRVASATERHECVVKDVECGGFKSQKECFLHSYCTRPQEEKKINNNNKTFFFTIDLYYIIYITLCGLDILINPGISCGN